MYDLYHNGQSPSYDTATNSIEPSNQVQSLSVINTGSGQSDSGGTTERVDHSTDYRNRGYEVNIPLYPWSSRPGSSHHQQHHHTAHVQPSGSQAVQQISTSIASSSNHPQYNWEQGIARLGLPSSAGSKIKYKNTVAHYLVRGRPLFVEVDFVPSK